MSNGTVISSQDCLAWRGNCGSFAIEVFFIERLLRCFRLKCRSHTQLFARGLFHSCNTFGRIALPTMQHAIRFFLSPTFQEVRVVHHKSKLNYVSLVIVYKYGNGILAVFEGHSCTMTVGIHGVTVQAIFTGTSRNAWLHISSRDCTP